MPSLNLNNELENCFITFLDTQKNGTTLASSYICTSKSSNSPMDQERSFDYFVYIYICNIIIPVLLNLIPAVLILVLNLILWFFIRNYTMKSKKGNKNKPRGTGSSNLSSTQKSHYFTIIILGIWLLVTTVPYYLFNLDYWFLVISDRESSILTTLKFLIRQGISSVFFNFNHCLNIIIYIIFHRDFQRKVLSNLIKVFNLNPIIFINKDALMEKSFKNKRQNELVTANKSNTTSNLIDKEEPKKVFTFKRNFFKSKNDMEKSDQEKSAIDFEND